MFYLELVVFRMCSFPLILGHLRKKHFSLFCPCHMIFNSERRLFCLYLWTAGGLCDGKCWPSARVSSARHLPDFHRAARHPAHALRLPPGLCQREQGQHRIPVLAQLVCADRQGERENDRKGNRSNGRVGYVRFDRIPPETHSVNLKMKRNQRSQTTTIGLQNTGSVCPT